MTPRRGHFITLEGGEGAGKSTQAKRLTDWLNANGYPAVYFRDPGGVPTALPIREILLKGDTEKFLPLTELFLFNANRVELLQRGILPALADGKIVVCDRFADTTLTHQGYGGGLSLDTIHAVQTIAVGSHMPDLTIILDIPAAVGLARGKGHTVGETRFEDKGVAFHERARQGFLTIAAENPSRCVVLDALAPLDEVAANIVATVKTRLLDKPVP